jgi:NAD(P)-dependent dehydrogenase (short-subunit alcohol dehydrogenase family)
MPTESKIAIVTGAGSGIGRACTLALHAVGWTVVLAGRRMKELEETASLASTREHLLAIPTDVSHPEQVRALFEQTMQSFGRLDLLFNNAGVAALAIPTDRLTPRQWQAVIDVNLTAAFLCTQQAMRIMKAQTPPGGRIINNGSVSAHSPRPNSAAYTASKHGLTGLTKSTALDGRAFQIACGQIDLGNIATDLATGMEHGTRQSDGRFLVEPVMTAQHVAAAVLYMASLPLEANVPFLTLMPSKMPLLGRG